MKRLCLTLLLVAWSGPAAALPLILDYTGFTWSTDAGGLPVTFQSVGVFDGFSQPVNLVSETYTYHLSGLVLSSVTTLSPSTKRFAYVGGTLGIYRSAGEGSRGYDYGVNPANSTAPATFVDGVEWLRGPVTTFTVTVNSALNLGNLSSTGRFLSGEFAPYLEEDQWSAFAGLTGRAGNGIPAGYRYRLDGQATSRFTEPVPEPRAVWLLGLGVAGILALRRRLPS